MPGGLSKKPLHKQTDNEFIATLAACARVDLKRGGATMQVDCLVLGPERLSELDRRAAARWMKDEAALDGIAHAMSGEWTSDTADIIAQLVRRTGREIEEL